MLELFRGLALFVATVGTGLMAGVFGLYAHTIMPGLGRTDDRTFVGAFQSIDRAVVNPLLIATLIGTLVFTGIAAVLHLRGDGRALLPWIGVAFVLYLLAFIITVMVNVPLNDGIKAAGNPDQITNLAAVRERFNEAKWVRWNLVRAVASTVAFGCLALALMQYGNTLPRNGV